MLIGIYPRKFFFFLFIGFLTFGGYRVSHGALSGFKVFQSVSADVPVGSEQYNQSKKIGVYNLEIDLNKNGSAQIGDKVINNFIKARSDYDEMRYIVLREPNDTYSKATVTVKLPDGQLKRLTKDPETIAVHGASATGARLNGNEIIYEAINVGQSSTMTITATFPKSYFNLSTSTEIGRSLGSIPPITWVITGIVLPPIALIIVFYMLFGSRFQMMSKKVKGEVAIAPSQVSPALVSIMTHGRVTSHTIMATLVDLANRGYIDIYNRNNDFVIYKKEIVYAQEIELKNYEKILLEKIFLPKQTQVGSAEVEDRMSRHLFSRKIAQIFLEVYQEGVNNGYFTDSPARIHLKYRMVGITTFFIGLIGYLIFAISAADPKFVLFMWIALVFLGMLIVNLAPNLTGFSPKGQQIREQWLKFRNFLSAERLIVGHDELFSKYFTYAIAMDCEIDWAARFSESNFVMPKWYDFSPGQLNGVENFAKSFFPILDFIGKSLSSSSDPLVR